MTECEDCGNEVYCDCCGRDPAPYRESWQFNLGMGALCVWLLGSTVYTLGSIVLWGIRHV